MAYLQGKIQVLDEQQYNALRGIPASEIAKMSPEAKINILLQYAEIRATQKEAFWNAIASAATVAIPLLAFFGIERWGRKK